MSARTSLLIQGVGVGWPASGSWPMRRASRLGLPADVAALVALDPAAADRDLAHRQPFAADGTLDAFAQTPARTRSG